ncbi:MAG TPA: MFS transporter [Acidobacteriaceae bacterium]
MPTEVRERPYYRWAVVAMLWCVCLFNYADRQSIFSVFPLLANEFRISDFQLGIIASSFMWMYAGFGPVAGWISDRLPRKTVILGALAIWSIATGLTAFATGYRSLVAVRALGGLAEAFYFPAAMSMLGDYHGPASRSRAMSIHQSAVYIGSIAGATLSAVIAEHHGWRPAFLLFGGIGVLLSGLLLLLLREPVRTASLDSEHTPDRAGILSGIGDLLANRFALALMAIFVGANFVAVIFLTWLPTFLYRKFSMTLTMAGFNASAYLQLASVAGVVLGGVLADRASRRERGGRIRIQAMGLLLGVPFLFLSGWTTSTKILLVSFVGFGLCKGLYDSNIWASLYDVIPANRRGIAAGVMNSLGWLGGGMAPIAVAAAMRSTSLSVCLSATAGIYLVLGMGALLLKERLKDTRSRPLI